MTFSRGSRGTAGDLLRTATHVSAAALVVTATLATLWAGPAASASSFRATSPSSSPSAAPSPAQVKFYIVPPATNGAAESLFVIAAKTLGNGNRYLEIFNLNKGRLQPNGGRLENPQAIDAGWILQLPADAAGPGVQFGPLPAVTAAATLSTSDRPSQPSTTAATATATAPGLSFGDANLIGAALIVFAIAGLVVALGRRRRRTNATDRRKGRPMAARRRDRDGADGYRDRPEDDPGQRGPVADPAWPGPGRENQGQPGPAQRGPAQRGPAQRGPAQRGPAQDPAWAGHPSFPGGDYPAQMRAIGRSGGPRRESPTTLHHDRAWETAPGPRVQDPVGNREPGPRGPAARPAPGPPDRTQRWSAQQAQAAGPADPPYYEVASGDGQLQAVLTKDPADGRAGTRDFGTRTGEIPQFARAGTAELVDDPIQREAEALWEADSGRLAQRILSDADRQAIQIRQQASAQAAATLAAAERETAEVRQQAAAQAAATLATAEREAAELRAAVVRMAAELGTVAAYVTESLGAHAKPPTRADALLGRYVTENLAISAQPAARPATRPEDLAGEPSPSTRPEARPLTVPAARPAERPAGKPAARPGGRPAARPAGKPAARPAGKPAAGRGRQVAAMRFAAIGTSALFLVAVVAGVAEVYLHGFNFFIFRATGTGETGPSGLNENQGPGQPDAPKPTPSHIKVQPSPHRAVTVHNGQ